MGLSRTQIATATSRFASARTDCHGIPLVFRGAEIRGIVTEVTDPIALDSGGFTEGATFTILILSSALGEAPRLRETILEPASGRRFSIQAVHTPPASSPLGGMHRITAALT